MKAMTFCARGLRFASCLGVLLLSAVVGCAPGKGKVSGRVLYNGTPLPGGTVTFRPAEPQYNPVVAALDEQGNYEAVLPVGAVQVSVDNRALLPRKPSGGGAPSGLPAEVRRAIAKAKAEPAAAPAEGKTNTPPPPSGRYVPIPSHYYDLQSSGLQFTVEPGEQKHDIELLGGR